MYLFEKYLERNFNNIFFSLVIASLVCVIYIFFSLVSFVNSYDDLHINAQLEPIRGEEGKISPSVVGSTGDKNVYRKVKHKEFGELIELSTYEEGKLIYFIEFPYSEANRLFYDFELLSTQGSGMLSVSLLDADKKLIFKRNDVYTGNVQVNLTNLINVDKHYRFNYKGDWIKCDESICDLFSEVGIDVKTIDKNVRYCRLELLAGEGQHALVRSFGIYNDPAKAINIHTQTDKLTYNIGDKINVRMSVKNVCNYDLRDIKFECYLPDGYGILGQDNSKILALLPANSTTEIEWHFVANRDSAVNFGKKWQVNWCCNKQDVANIGIDVVDTNAGKVYYVMTEDLEPIDGSGYEKSWGAQTGWIIPHELEVQLINKAEALNAIADKYSAKWTHYLAAPVLESALWADKQSSKGVWKKTVDAIKKSVSSETKKGHEYALHLHIDYDPYLKGNVLSYNEQCDGLWANHLQHGWAHSVHDIGNISDHNSRIGTLFYYQSAVDELSANSSQGQILTARVGSFDFGYNNEEMEKSITAYKTVGLWGSTDADGNIEGKTARSYGNEIYFTKNNSINLRATNFDAIGLVEYCPTPFDNIQYDTDDANRMNQKVKEAYAHFAPYSKILPGVHAIVGFTHAMFVMGEDGWQSTAGKQFSEIDKHLEFINSTYVAKGMLNFATGTELTKAYLDYYTPKLLAVYGKKIAESILTNEYEIELLGKDIPVDDANRHLVSIKYPLYLSSAVFFAEIKKNGKTVFSTTELPNSNSEIFFYVDDKNAKYTMKLYLSKYIQGYLKMWKRWKNV